MPERRLTTLTNNKRKLLTAFGYNSIKGYRKDNAEFRTDASAYKYLLGEYNQMVDMLNEQERTEKKELERRRKAYEKEKRKSEGNYNRTNYKLLPNNSKIDKVGKGIRTADLERYNTQSGVFLKEVRVYYDCRQKADDWTEDNQTWKAPFRTSRAEVVIADSIAQLNKKATYKAQQLQAQLLNVSPELNDNFQVKMGKTYNSNNRVAINKIKMKQHSPLKLNGDPLPHFEMGEGRCVYDALIHLWSQPNSKMLKKANVEYLNSIFITDANLNPETDGVDTDTLTELAKRESFSLYAFDIHDKLISKYTSEKTRQSKKPPLIYRIYNEHMYLISDKSVQASLIAKNRNGENIRHNSIESDLEKLGIKTTDEKTYTNIIAEKDKLNGNKFAYDYIFKSGDVPFPFTKKNINYDKGNILSMKIADKQIFTKPVEDDILEYLKNIGEDYKGQHYINLLMEKWEEHYGGKLHENQLISSMNPIVCDLLNEENVKNRVHFGAMMELDDVEQKIDDEELVGADLIKCYSSILDNPMDNWLVYGLTDEIENYNGKLQTGLYFVETTDLTILHQTNWYSNTIIEYALKEGIKLKIIKQYIPTEQHENRDYFKSFIDYISGICGMKLTKNILNSITGMMGKTKQSSYNISITTDMNEVWNGLEDNTDKLDNFIFKNIGTDDKPLYVYGFKNKKNIYTNNLPMYIQILDQSNIKLHQLAKHIGGELVFRKTDAVMMYMGKGNGFIEDDCEVCDKPTFNSGYYNDDCEGYICRECYARCGDVNEEYYDKDGYDKTKRENWGKHTIMDKDELKKYDYTRTANRYRNVVNTFEKHIDWRTPHIEYGDDRYKDRFTSSSQYKEIMEYAIQNGGLLICSRAGTGKSYVVQKSVEDEIIEDDKRTRLAFTNKARRNINGSTIHSAISINCDTEKASSKMVQTYKGKKVIVVDEISMLSKQLWSFLVLLKRVSGAVFVLIGDYRQLPAVELVEHDYFDSSIVRYLANNNRIELTERQRYDKELWDFLDMFWEKGQVGKNLLFTKEIDYDAYNICYYNKTRKAVNKKYMEFYKPNDALFIPHEPKDLDDKATDIYIYQGLPVMAVVNKTKAKKDDEHQTLFCNSDTMRVVEYNKETITMKLDVPDEDDNDMVVVKVSEFHKAFVCNYCSTTHKNQGATIDRNIQLWDWKQMKTDRRIAYTAISRARRIQQLKVVA